MKLSYFFLSALFATVPADPAFAVSLCSSLPNKADVTTRIPELVRYRTPVKYQSLAKSIKFSTTGPEGNIIPFAGFQNGERIVVISPLFADIACNIALSAFVTFEGTQVENFELAANAAAKCIDAGKSQQQCLVGFSDMLAEKFSKPFSELPGPSKDNAYQLYEQALAQVAMHEYAHHFLDHLPRIESGGLSRIDAEFEADLFAIMSGVQDGDAPSAMAYLFHGIASIERFTDKLVTKKYETASCRTANVENITRFIDIVPMFLLNLASGREQTPDWTKRATEHLSRQPVLSIGSCERLRQDALEKSFEELKRLHSRIVQDQGMILTAGDKVDITKAGNLLREIADMVKSFSYMNILAAEVLSIVVHHWGLSRSLTPLIEQIDRLLDIQALTDNFSSRTYGRLLMAQGLTILQSRVDFESQFRLKRGYDLLQRAVHYYPELSEAWMNLSFLAVMRGDCAGAANFAERSYDTSSEAEDLRLKMKGLAALLKEWAQKPEVCKAESADFHIYPGL